MRPRLLPLGLSLLVCLPAAAAASNRGSFVTQGALVARQGKAVVKVPLKHTRVRIRVAGQLAETTVSQVFENPFAHKIEAVYVFPLPTDAAVRDYSLRINDERHVRGRLMRRGQARAVYRRARAAGQVAALLTQERPNLFTNHVANLEPGKQLQVQIQYVSTLRYDAGVHELVFPMVVGPRYVPRRKGRARSMTRLSPPMLPPALRSAHDIDLRVELQPGLPVERLQSPSHRIRVTAGVAGLELVLDARDRIPNKDFVLRYRVAGKAPRAAALTHRPRPGEPGYLMLTVQPPEERFPGKVLPRELIFVVDSSSSMSGAPLATARQLLRLCLRQLNARDTFQIVRFADASSTLGPGMIANRPQNVKLALAWLARLRAAGGTHVIQGIETALALPHDPGRLRLVVFITDGYVGNEEQILALVQRRLGSARLFSLGVGSAVNRYLLEELAVVGRGAMQVVTPGGAHGAALERFFSRISSPVLSDLTVQLSGALQLEHAAPLPLPDLFVGQPLVLRARLRGAGAGVALVQGRSSSGETVRLRVPVQFPAARHGNPALALSWARAQLATLQRRTLRGDRTRLRQQIIQLALEHRLLTRYTAFVAVDTATTTGAGEAVRVDVPVDRPSGMLGAVGSGVLGQLSGASYGHGGIGVAHSVAYSRASMGRVGGVVRVYSSMRGVSSDSVAPAAPSMHLHTLRPALVVMAGARVMGSVDKQIIRRVVRQRRNQIKYCYEKELQRDPGLRGKVVITFTFGASGKVLSARVRSSTLGSPVAEACIARAIRGWDFPRVPGGHDVEVSYPFVFVPGSGRR